MTTIPSSLRQWHELSESEQTELLEAYGHYQDQLPPSCSMDTKVSRFQAWLLERGVSYDHS